MCLLCCDKSLYQICKPVIYFGGRHQVQSALSCVGHWGYRFSPQVYHEILTYIKYMNNSWYLGGERRVCGVETPSSRNSRPINSGWLAAWLASWLADCLAG